MLATRIRQRDGIFYTIAYPAEDLLKKVRFSARFDAEEGSVGGDTVKDGDEVAAFIAKVERSDKAFQRQMAKRKVGEIRNFFETAGTQPLIPGAVLLFTPERLDFRSVGQYEDMGDLREPDLPFLIIDGQHRLAALHFHLQAHPEEAASIRVPCMVFDGRTEDFAAEMFVIINSTPTRINKSHLVELYERVAYVGADRKLAAAVVKMLYAEDDSPLRYRINRLGGRSGQEKWILQAEVFNELHRWVVNQGLADDGRMKPEKLYGMVRDFFKATASVFADSWGDAAFMLTKPVMLKAFIRVCADLCDRDADPAEDRLARWKERAAPWAKRLREFRADGFYERFPAKGQIERVSKIHRDLAQTIGIGKKGTTQAADG